jgi:hypothetical protein
MDDVLETVEERLDGDGEKVRVCLQGYGEGWRL